MVYDTSPQDEACQLRFKCIVSVLSTAILRLQAKSEESEKSVEICE